MKDMETRSAKKSMRVKIISMGSSEVGKSCLIKRYCERRFVPKYLPTIGIDYGVTKVVVKGCVLKVNIFDMAGHPIFYEVRNEFYKDTQGAVLAYDVTDRSSFEGLDAWLTEMRSEIGSPSEMDSIVFVVCANKTDKGHRVVDEMEGRLWADSKGIHYFETSAQSGDGVSAAFEMLFEGILSLVETGSRAKPIQTQLGYTKEQVDAIYRLKNAKDNYERLGLAIGSSKEDVNRAYRRLAVLLHPDKNVAPGSEEAFKILLAARTALLKVAK